MAVSRWVTFTKLTQSQSSNNSNSSRRSLALNFRLILRSILGSHLLRLCLANSFFPWQTKCLTQPWFVVAKITMLASLSLSLAFTSFWRLCRESRARMETHRLKQAKVFAKLALSAQTSRATDQAAAILASSVSSMVAPLPSAKPKRLACLTLQWLLVSADCGALGSFAFAYLSSFASFMLRLS